MTFYLALGAIGLLCFADDRGGVGVLLGATAGSIYAYPIAAGLTGYLSRRCFEQPGQETFARLGLGALAGYVLLFCLGAALLGGFGLMATQGLGLTVLASSVMVATVGALLGRWRCEVGSAFLVRMAIGLVGVLVIYGLGWIVVALVTGMGWTVAFTPSSPSIAGSVSALVTGMGWTVALAQDVAQFVPVDLANVFIAAGGAGFLLPPRRTST